MATEKKHSFITDKGNLKSSELSEKISNVLKEKNAGDIKILDVSDKTTIADFFVISTGRNITHVRALAELLEENLESDGIFATRKEGLREARWIVLDYGSVIVHIFNADTRDFYCLEKLWS
ncbi:MAG: ribosome silencing factor [Christensenellaceae bacterium]|jgi:ribosome-associated protein|nr:ribosome silencing factor [Christensenellaceae bacterium]